MTYDEELYASHVKIRNWYLEHLKRYKRELPKYEFSLVKNKLDPIIKQADRFYKERALTELEVLRKKEAQFFFLPWEAILWYSQQKKGK